jgi:hypothetical protein
MFCVNCGNKNENSVKFCTSCGAPVREGVTHVSPSKPKGSGNIAFGPIKINANGENKTIINVFGKTIVADTFFMLASALLVVAFFMPFFSISSLFAKQSISGWNIASENSDDSSTAILLFLIPIAIFVLFKFKPQLETRFNFVKENAFKLSTLGFVLGLIVLHFLRIIIGDDTATGFTLSLITYIVASVVSFLCFLSKKKSNAIALNSSAEGTQAAHANTFNLNESLSNRNIASAIVCVIAMLMLHNIINVDLGVADTRDIFEKIVTDFAAEADAFRTPLLLGNAIITGSKVLAVIILLNIVCVTLAAKENEKEKMLKYGKLGALLGALLPMALVIVIAFATVYPLGHGRGYAYPDLQLPGVFLQMVIPLIVLALLNASSYKIVTKK